MSFYNLLDTMISKLNKSIKIEEQNLNISEKAQARFNINAASKNDVYKHNYLDNSDFTNPVNQRGLTSYTSIGFTIDRWRFHANNSEGACNIYDGYIEITAPTSGDDNYSDFYQALENFTDLQGKTCTFVANINGSICHTVFTMGGAAGGNPLTDGVFFFSIDGTMNCLIRTYASRTINIYWAALYEGEHIADTLPEYRPKGYAVELAECRRYSKVYDDCGNFGYCYASGYITGITFDNPMRVAPTVEQVGLLRLSDFSVQSAGSSHYTTKNGVTFFEVPGAVIGEWYRITNLTLSCNL